MFQSQASSTAQFQSQNLAELSAGCVCRVDSLSTDSPLRERLLQLGFLPGAALRVIRNPARGPLLVELSGARYALAHELARAICVNIAAD